ncbi:MAG: DUF1501 domain-containing protein [Verrucomicrobiota bacterium]
MPGSQPRIVRPWRITRRELLRIGALGLFGLSFADVLAGRAVAAGGGGFGRAKRCILLFMWGGPAHQDTWDLKPDAPIEVRGEFNEIPTNVPGIRISEHFPLLARRMDKLCVVRSMTHDNADHTSATHYLLTGEPPPRSTAKREQWPHFGSVLSSLGRGGGPLPPFVSMRPKLENDVPRFVEQSQGQFAGWLGQLHDPMTIDADPSRPDYKVAELILQPEISLQRLAQRRELLGQLDRRLDGFSPHFAAQDENHRRAFELLTQATAQRGAFNLDEEPRAMRERYGLNPHGQSVLQARRLIERGVPLVTVFWPNDGTKNVSVYWDTHSRNFSDLKTRLMPVADQAFSTLLDDLAERGLLEDTLVIWTGEFGRTPRVGQRSSDAGAGKDGRDHWGGCFTSVLAGGGVKGGFVFGKSDKEAAYPAENPVAPRDLIATVYHLLGVPEQQTLLDLGGRPQFIRTGKVIEALLA